MERNGIFKMVNKARIQGFTIVELVVVIILLGILAATAIPRFIDVDDDAHAAAIGTFVLLSTRVRLELMCQCQVVSEQLLEAH